MSNVDLKLLDSLSSEQKNACVCMENMLLTACPGSGKTRTVSYKLAFLVNQFQGSRRLHIAITYTNRAADEIMARLDAMDVTADNIWTGTIHQFCMEYIIRPYSMYSDRLRRGYHIIDEYVQREYKREIRKSLGINCKDWELDKHPRIKEAYKKLLMQRKEIDFEDILIESLKILEQRPYVAENIASIIASIQVDEYQDTNENQYKILAEICKKNNEIIISFIGDVNQAIYGGLDGIAKTKDEISSLFEQEFLEKHLTGCYRSIQQIVDYYSNYAVNRIEIASMRTDSDKDAIISFEDSISKEELADHVAEIVKERLDQGEKEEEICIIAPRWELIFSMANKLRMKLPDLMFNAPDITPFKYDPMNPFYLLAKLTFMKTQGHEKTRKRYANDVIGMLKNDYGINIKKGFDCFTLLKIINSVIKLSDADGIEVYKNVVGRVMSSLKVDLSNEEALENCYNQFLEKTYDRVRNNSLSTTCCDLTKCFEEKHGVVISTIHGVKGEEYNTVIAFGLLNGLVPHWNDIFEGDRRNTAYKLLYVLGSRAKENLYLISETGRTTSKGALYTATDEIVNVEWEYTKL